MIKNATKILLTLSLLVFGGLTVTYAQMNSDTVFRADIPNSFVLRDKIYPAGEYTIKPTDDPADSGLMLELQNAKGKSLAFFKTEAATADNVPKKSELVFHKIGDQYFLSKIWIKGETNGNRIEESKMEKELVAANKPMEESFVITEFKMKAKKMKN